MAQTQAQLSPALDRASSPGSVAEASSTDPRGGLTLQSHSGQLSHKGMASSALHKMQLPPV